jgi:hypothetical protein
MSLSNGRASWIVLRIYVSYRDGESFELQRLRITNCSASRQRAKQRRSYIGVQEWVASCGNVWFQLELTQPAAIFACCSAWSRLISLRIPTKPIYSFSIGTDKSCRLGTSAASKWSMTCLPVLLLAGVSAVSYMV